MGDLGAFCCSNPVCADLGKRGHGNLTVTAVDPGGGPRPRLRDDGGHVRELPGGVHRQVDPPRPDHDHQVAVGPADPDLARVRQFPAPEGRGRRD